MPTTQIILGAVNWTNYMHYTVCKVSAPSTVVQEAWIPVPFTNYTLVLTGLDADVYYINFYEAATNIALGTFRSQGYFSNLSPEYDYEIKFYEIGNLPATASLDVTRTILTDTYLISKNPVSFVKEAFRPLEPVVDIDFDNTTGDMELLTGTTFEDGEKFVVTIKFAVGTNQSTTSGGLYIGNLTVTDATKTLIAGDKNKRIRCAGTISTQVFTLAALSALAVEDGFYFDNTVGGTAMQVKLVLPGGDRIKYNGFQTASDEFAEFWIDKGCHLLIRKFSSAYWEVITPYSGYLVGQRQSANYIGQPLWVPEDGRLLDGDDYPRLWWWINNVLPGTQVITDDTVTGSYTHPAAKPGLFVKHSTLKKFRTPNTQDFSERGLKDFDTYGADATRLYDYPGGKQNSQVGEHTITLPRANNNAPFPSNVGVTDGPIPSPSTRTYTINYGLENISKNIGVIYLIHI